MFPGHFPGISRTFPGRFPDIFFKRKIADVSRTFPGRFPDISRIFPGHFSIWDPYGFHMESIWIRLKDFYTLLGLKIFDEYSFMINLNKLKGTSINYVGQREGGGY